MLSQKRPHLRISLYQHVFINTSEECYDVKHFGDYLIFSAYRFKQIHGLNPDGKQTWPVEFWGVDHIKESCILNMTSVPHSLDG